MFSKSKKNDRIVFFILGLILLFSFLTKVWRLGEPKTFIFDEVYVGFTASEIAKNNPDAWSWQAHSPKGFAYGWSHPYTGKMIIALPIKIFGFSYFSMRLMPMLAGILLSLISFLLARQLFPKKPLIGLISAFLIANDGLVLALSRIGLADTILTLFITTAVYFLFRKKYIISAIVWGLAISTKWSGVFFLPVLAIIVLQNYSWQRNFKVWINNLYQAIKIAILYLLIGFGVYLLSYLPFFLYGNNFEQFTMLQKQMYWYHTGLEATHPYQSTALTWTMDLRPVWFWVEYGKNTVKNIYALGNPIFFWGGIISVFFAIGYYRISKNKQLLQLIIAYFAFWLPWIDSPRIMFLYHYLPALPYLAIILGFMLNEMINFNKKMIYIVGLYLICVLAVFVYFYPYNTGLPVAKDKVANYQWLKTWK